MALTYVVKLMSETGFDVSGTTENGRSMVNHSASQSYQVRYTATAGETPDMVNDVMAGCVAGLPTVNETAWYSPTTGLTMPYAVCRSKNVTRNQDRRMWFDVKCKFETGPVETQQCASAPTGVPTDITPQVTVSIGQYERVMYQDKDGEQCWKLPTETPYAAPVMETIPTLQLNIVQFEAAITFEQMLQRSFKLNSGAYRGKPAGYWMTGAVQAIDQVVTIDAGGTQATWAKVTYPVMLSERFFWAPGVTPNDANKTIYSWDHVQPLVDTMKMSGGEPVPMTSGNGNVKAGYINTDGTERIPASGDEDRPDYKRHKTQESIDFSTFLQA